MGTTAINAQIRQSLKARLIEARARTDELFHIVRPQAFQDRPIPERHRIIFYLGHHEAFDWNLLAGPVFGRKPFHQEFERLFGFGIDPVGGDLPDDKPPDWPGRPEIERYNQHLRHTIDACLETTSFDDRAHPLLLDGFILHVAIEHRLMHAETLAYMLHQLPLDRKFERPIVPAPAALPARAHRIEIPAGWAALAAGTATSAGTTNSRRRKSRSLPSSSMPTKSGTASF